MDYIYIFILLLIIFILINKLSEDRCKNKEYFTQIEDNNFICTDEKASNSYLGEIKNKKVDNSYCIYNYESVCNRPYADNYVDINYNDEFVCGDKNYNNYVDVFEYDDKNNKKRLKINEINGQPLLYLDREVIPDVDGVNLLYKSDNSIVYKQTKKIDNSKCKMIDNKLCRFPMNNSKINSLYGISKNEDEFKSLVNSEGDLLPNNYLTIGPLFDDITKKLRDNKKMLFNELFFNSDSIKGLGLNLYDNNGFVDMNMLTSASDVLINKDYKFNLDGKSRNIKILGSYIDNLGKVVNRKGYNFSLPKNYFELVKLANENDLHVALAVSKNCDKYACGIGKTKAIACDIALARCILFADIQDIETLFKDQKTNLQNELKRRKNLYKKTSVLGYIIDSEINDESTNDKIYTKIGINSYIDNMNELSLAMMYYRSLSHKEIFNLYDNLFISEEEIKSVERKVPSISSLDTVIRYILNNNINKENPCGILMIDEERYINFSNDATEILDKCKLTEPVSICNNQSKCNEASVIGMNDNDECFMIQDFKITLPNWDKYDLLKEKDNKENWINEKNEIDKNNKIDLVNSMLEKCNLVGKNCIIYKINDKTYSYNSLFS
jgi:hypothetical protein